MRILLFGTYERDYPRNAQVASCLRRAGVEVVERHVAVWEGREHKWATGPAVLGRLALAQARLARPPRERFDAVLVGYPGHLDMPLARRVAGKQPLVFNPLVSLGDTLVADRGRFQPGSIPARLLHRVDRHALRLADLVIADTEANADFLAQLGGLPRERVAVCLVGAEDRLFSDGWVPSDPFTCVFIGKLIPLHGVETILEAARLAPGMPFRVIGSGQLDRLLAGRPPNVEWIRWRPYVDLPAELRRAGCALGVFGTSDKARRVIPNKAYQALACGVPLVTSETPASRELLADGESALLVEPGSPAALAAAVERLASEPALARRLGGRGLAVYRARASEDVLGQRWKQLLQRLL